MYFLIFSFLKSNVKKILVSHFLASFLASYLASKNTRPNLHRRRPHLLPDTPDKSTVLVGLLCDHPGFPGLKGDFCLGFFFCFFFKTFEH